MNRRKTPIRMASLFLVAGLLSAGFGFAGESRVRELAKLSIEELIRIKVTSVLKTPQPWSESPAAVYVVTAEDIRRSGAENIPDLLRIVPGVQVAELDENIFAVSIRGFNDIHANKLLVMVDGRSVYNHIFSGVIWSHLDLFMEDIDRIEVIRGPGSSVWGANAVNGVINILTRKSGDTTGALAEFGGGRPDAVSWGARYGGDLGEDAALRIYAKRSESANDHISQQGFEAKTELSSGSAGFRADWDVGMSDVLNLQGGVARGRAEAEDNNPQHPEIFINHRGGHFLGQWRHIFSGRSEAVCQIYYQHETRVDEYQFDTIDLDFRHDIEWSAKHRVGWGFGYRFVTDEMDRGLIGQYTFDPSERDQQVFSFFIQDTFQMIPDHLNLILGSKFEHNDYTGFEFQPGIRVSLTPHKRHALWGAVSRAVRTPSRLDSDSFSEAKQSPGQQGPGGAGNTQTVGNEDSDSEDLYAYEIGYRTNPSDILWIDFALFYNRYDNLSTYEEKETDVWAVANEMEGETYGLEIAVDCRPVEWWRISGAWSYLETDMRLKDEAAADLTEYVEETNPRHQLSVHSAFDIGSRVTLDFWLRHVDAIRNMRPRNALNPVLKQSDDYTVFDARLGWKPSENIELSATGRNLGGAHPEFTNYEVEQTVFLKLKIEFGK